MAGTFTVGEVKVRPGAYFNIKKGEDGANAGAINGIVAVLFRSDWGPLSSASVFSAAEGFEKLYGKGGTTDAISLAMEGGAETIIACRVGSGGTKGTISLKKKGGSGEAVVITAKQVGAKPFTVTIKDKLSDDMKRECIIYSGTKEFEKVSFDKGEQEAASLAQAFGASKAFLAKAAEGVTGSLETVAQAEFVPGTNPTVTAEDYSDALTAIEAYAFNTVCVDTEDMAVQALVAAFLDRIAAAGQLAQGVVAEKRGVALEERMAHAAAFNSEKMVYVLNASVASMAYGAMDGYQTAAKLAGMIAACVSNQSLTHTVMSGITQLEERLTPTQMTTAETMGCLVLSVNASQQIWIDNAINTLVTPDAAQDLGWKKIRRTKTRYELMLRANRQADAMVGKVENDANGRATIRSKIQEIGMAMIEEGKLLACEVKESKANRPSGDSVWFDIDCVDKDSAEHLYLTYTFQFGTEA